MLNQISPDGILHQIPHHTAHIVILSQDAIEITFLPQSAPHGQGERRAGSLLCKLRKFTEIAFKEALDEQMNMVRHEAVRKNFKPFVTAASPKMFERVPHFLQVEEDSLAISATECQEIPVKATVTERSSARRPRHDGPLVATPMPLPGPKGPGLHQLTLSGRTV
jgi:hypothetical protein